jgi:hypothetical protein
MFADAISFRKADETDLTSIWYLLHANSRIIKDDQLREQINQIYVLEYQKRILGVLCGTYSGGQVDIRWIAIHPLYPEHSLQEAMIQQFTGIFCRISGDGEKKTSVFNWFFNWFRGKPLKFFSLTKGAAHGVQDQ